MNLGFLVYDSRSGSTLLASLLHTHPDIVASFETEFLISAIQYQEKHGHLPENSSLYEMLMSDKRLAEWGMGITRVYQNCLEIHGKVTVTHMIQALFAFAKQQDNTKANASVFIIKQGLLTRHMDSLLRIWPNASIIHIFRDGRAVFASKRMNINIDSRLPMATDPVQAAYRWKQIQEKMSSLSAHGAVLEIQYETLLSNTKTTLAPVWKYLGVDKKRYPAKKSNAAYAKHIPENQKKIHPLVGKAPDTRRITAWQQVLSPVDIWRYERVAHNTLKTRGYTPICFVFKKREKNSRFLSFTYSQPSPV